MKPRRIHRWVRTAAAAKEIQLALASRIVLSPFKLTPCLVAGLDVSYNRRSPILWAGAVLMEWPSLEVVEEVTVRRAARFPYVPTYLSFRELPACIDALKRLKRRAACLICDGQGLAHPRFFGLAAHLGYLMDLPTVGCAKSRLVGEYEEPGPNRGEWTKLTFAGRTVGAVLRTRDRVKSLFVSPGHKMNVAGAVRLILSTTKGTRLCEPIRRAHALVNRARQNG